MDPLESDGDAMTDPDPREIGDRLVRGTERVLWFWMVFSVGIFGVMAGTSCQTQCAPRSGDGSCRPTVLRGVGLVIPWMPAPPLIAPSVGPPDAIERAIAILHFRESRQGSDPRCRRGHVGPAGEQGEFQVTPIWCEDVRAISGQIVDPFDRNSCRRAIRTWLEYYGPRVGAVTPDDLAELYRRGPGGYRGWKRSRGEVRGER